MFKTIEGILNFLFRVSKMKDKANRIKQDEEKRESSMYFGILSVTYSLVSLGCCFFGAYLFKNFMDSALVIFTIVIGLIFMISGIVLFIWSLVSWILQFTINKSWIGWLAMLIFFAGLIGSVILVLGTLGGSLS